MPTRRRFIATSVASGVAGSLAAALPAAGPARALTEVEQIARNKAIVRRFKEAQGTKDEPEAMRELLAPDYKRRRAGLEHLAANARDQGFPAPGPNLRDAFPDRTDTIEGVVGAWLTGVAMLFRVRGTHRGNLFGIPPTGKTIDIYEIGFFTAFNDKIFDAWFMADELGLLMQLGARLPPRNDNRRIVPPITGAGSDPDALAAGLSSISYLSAMPGAWTLRQNGIMAVRSRSLTDPADRAADFRQARAGFQHLHDYGNAHGVGHQTITTALPDRYDRVGLPLAEGDKVWMQCEVIGSHFGALYGIPPSRRIVDVPEVAILTFAGGKVREAWSFADELGLLLQIGAVDEVL
jgi:predicted ester cyclase